MSLRCEECGAASRSADDRFCSYCGAALPVPTTPRAAERADVERRFDALRDHPEARAAMAERPSGAGAVVRHGTGAVFLVVFAVAACAMALFMIQTVGSVTAPAPFALFFRIIPILVVGVAVFAALRAMTRTARVAGSPTLARLARILEEHQEFRATGDHERSVHVVTLESSEGERSSYEVPRSLAHTVTRDDMGVAHTRGGELLRFTRVDV